MSVLPRARLLPILVLVASLSFAVRVGDFVSGFDQMGAAFAQQEVKTQPPPLPALPDAAKAPGVPADMAAPTAPTSVPTSAAEASPSSGSPTPMAPPDMKGATPVEPVQGPDDSRTAGAKKQTDWQDAGDVSIETSPVREDLYKDLAKRRAELDQREREIVTRQAVLEAGSREVEQKLRELTSLRNEIEGMMKKQGDEEKTRVESLVKIYETMKPSDAARIFNSLDMDVLIQVLTKMSERKAAPVIAEMTADRARAVTVLMAQQRQLPSLPSQ